MHLRAHKETTLEVIFARISLTIITSDGCDYANKDKIKKTGTTIVMISHLAEEAVALADRVVLMKNHRVTKTFPISLSRPRRKNGEIFEKVVWKIRKKLIAD